MARDPALVRGDNQEWFIRLKRTDGTPLPLRSVAIRITAKPPRSDEADDSDAIYTHTASFGTDGVLIGANGIRLGGTARNDDGTLTTYTSPDDGVFTEYLTAGDIVTLADRFDSLPAVSGAKPLLDWDIQVTDAQGQRKTVAQGSLSMVRDIGRSM